MAMMSIGVVTKSTDVDLTTTSALKALVLGATATSTVQDAHLSNLIRRASRIAEQYVGYPISVQTYQEAVAGYGMRALLLGRTPLRAVDRLLDGTDSGMADEVKTSDYRVEDPDAGIITRDKGFPWNTTLQWRAGGYGSGYATGYGADAIPLEPAPVPGQEYKPWLADYRAGWTYDGVTTSSPNWSTAKGTTDTGRTLPEDLEQGVLMIAQTLYQNVGNVLSERLGDLQVNYGSESVDGVPAWLAVGAPFLRPYQRIGG